MTMSKHTLAPLDFEAIAEILADEATDTLDTVDLESMRAFLCSSAARGDFTILQAGVTGGGFLVENAPGTDHTVATLDIEQVVEILADGAINKVGTIEQVGMRAFLCSGQHQGGFTIFQCGVTGEGFVIQNADEESTHADARAALFAA